jgi:hypothetical protein
VHLLKQCLGLLQRWNTTTSLKDVVNMTDEDSVQEMMKWLNTHNQAISYIASAPYCPPHNPSLICCDCETECTNITVYSKCLKSS